VQKSEKKKDWALSPEAFRNFLEWLDEGADSGGQKYLEMRRRLVAYFDRKNCLNPDELADETLNRAARRLAEEGKIESEAPAKFCYITAKFVFMESLRAAHKQSVSLDDVLRTEKSGDFSAEASRNEKELKEKMLVCLEECANKLEPENREMIIRYYFGEERVKIENRLLLAKQLGISKNALSIRACRIRDRLEACVGKCAEKQ
jgi:DNA-directed RNA polymerase specialized sigma24 family protein